MADKADKKDEAIQKDKPESKPRAPKARKNPKVSQMTLSQVEEALQKVEEGMGGLQSRHARFLLSRRDALLARQGSGSDLKKAA